MELVNGLPLTKFCDEAKLTPKERLEIFVPICQAVQHAHQKGIVHRDLKPANILVTLIDGKPVPKVIDFGVAKATAGKLTDESLSTQFGAVVGTLEYMSPEQAGFSGEDIDTRSDIYSLGVILYELLTGLRPIAAARLKRAALSEMIRIIREEEPSKPSTRLSTDASLSSQAALRQTEPRRLMTMLRGELDWVVMKCLEKERDRRYETASGLARDIQHYLADEVVEARPPSAAYRLRKFASRHRGQVVAASLVLLSLVLGMVGTTWGLISAARANTALAAANTDLTAANAKVQARYNLAVDAIKTFHTGVSEDFLLKQNQFKELRDRLLKSAADFYGKLSALLGNETDLTSRRALAASNFELADLTDKVGRKEEALAAHRAALAARKALAAGPEADALTSADVGRSLTAIATLLEGIGKTGDAVATYREAEALLEARAASAASAGQVRAALADCRSRLGYLLYSTGHAEDGLLVLRKARSEQEVLAGAPKATMEAPGTGEHHQPYRQSARKNGSAGGSRRRLPQGAGDLSEAGRGEPGQFRDPTSPGDHLQQPRQSALDDCRPVVGVGSSVPRGDGDQAKARRRQSRRHRIPPRSGIEPQKPRGSAEPGRPRLGVGGRIPQGDDNLSEAGRRKPNRVRIPRQPGRQPFFARDPAASERPARGIAG